MRRAQLSLAEGSNRAAAYVRMSTEHQQYSTENQLDAIRVYAAAHELEIVRVYTDAGKSGLSLDGREALQQLLRDVDVGQSEFSVVLVYDVSRWGRFQDIDKGGHYEYICRKAGIPVLYCGEQFAADDSIGSNVHKNIMRMLASLHSKLLSQKVFIGQKNLIEHGWRQGGPSWRPA